MQQPQMMDLDRYMFFSKEDSTRSSSNKVQSRMFICYIYDFSALPKGNRFKIAHFKIVPAQISNAKKLQNNETQ
jgi:hypothetical protein